MQILSKELQHCVTMIEINNPCHCRIKIVRDLNKQGCRVRLVMREGHTADHRDRLEEGCWVMGGRVAAWQSSKGDGIRQTP